MVFAEQIFIFTHKHTHKPHKSRIIRGLLFYLLRDVHNVLPDFTSIS